MHGVRKRSCKGGGVPRRRRREGGGRMGGHALLELKAVDGGDRAAGVVQRRVPQGLHLPDDLRVAAQRLALHPRGLALKVEPLRVEVVLIALIGRRVVVLLPVRLGDGLGRLGLGRRRGAARLLGDQPGHRGAVGLGLLQHRELAHVLRLARDRRAEAAPLALLAHRLHQPRAPADARDLLTRRDPLVLRVEVRAHAARHARRRARQHRRGPHPYAPVPACGASG